jgi:hypothetical protein
VKGFTRSRTIATWLFCLAMIPMASGCVGLAAQILYVWKGTTVDAESRDLEYKKVAVVCASDQGYVDQSGVEEVSRHIEKNLKDNVKGIKLVSHKEVLDWIDSTDNYKIDPREIGKSVKAERVLYVQITDFSISEGSTLYRGRARWKATVYDIVNGGDPLDQSKAQDFKFPTNTERAQIDQREESFREEFVPELARVVARRYHKFDKLDDIAGDRPISN